MCATAQTPPALTEHLEDMLHTFLATHRLELIARCQVKALRRPSRAPLSPGLQHGIPQFLDQLIATLRLDQMPDKDKGETISGAAGGLSRARSEVGEAAALHDMLHTAARARWFRSRSSSATRTAPAPSQRKRAAAGSSCRRSTRRSRSKWTGTSPSGRSPTCSPTHSSTPITAPRSPWRRSRSAIASGSPSRTSAAAYPLTPRRSCSSPPSRAAATAPDWDWACRSPASTSRRASARSSSATCREGLRVHDGVPPPPASGSAAARDRVT